MSNILMPTPGPERRHLTADLPVLRAKLGQQRRLCIQRLAELTAEDQPLLLRHANTARSTIDAAAGRAQAKAAALVRQALGEIETALNRMRTGRYGYCLYCGAELPLVDLHAFPQAGACATCGGSMAGATGAITDVD
jgi:DnaK suppressor protein